MSNIINGIKDLIHNGEKRMEKLKKKLNKLENERINLDQNYRGNKRKAKLAKDSKRYGKYKVLEQFYEQQLSNKGEEISELQELIDREEFVVKQKKQKEEVKKVSIQAIKLLEDINIALKRKNYIQAFSLIEKLDVFYKENSNFSKEAVKPLDYLGTQSMAIRLGHIQELSGEISRVSKTRGPKVAANIKAKIELWSKQLQGQISTAIDMFKDKA